MGNNQGVDPVFAAIERHRAAYDDFLAAVRLTDKPTAKQEGREVTAADKATYESACVAESEAAGALLNQPPQTRAGMKAALVYLSSCGGDELFGNPSVYFATLLLSPVLTEDA